MTIKERISKIVNDSTGLKSTELAVKVVCEVPDCNTNEVLHLIEELVKEGEIIELEYILPQINYRIKSIYFPKGTDILLKLGEKK